jgi:N-acetylglucosamine-6-phosphate deacetylase
MPMPVVIIAVDGVNVLEVQGNRLTPNGELETVSLVIEDGNITDVHVYDSVDDDLPLLMPGFIDIHVHGGGGADTMDADEDAFRRIVKTHARHGTTGLLLTTVTESPERIDAVLDVAKRYILTQSGASYRHTNPSGAGAGAEHGHHTGEFVGAEVLGVHLEGPFIHPDKAGAQRPDKIIHPNRELAERWFSSGIVKLMTLAPERPNAHEVAQLARRHGVLASVGHTTAGYEDVAAAKDSGFRHVTHLCNAMPPLLHRSVGPIGYLVDDNDFTADIICDGIHVAGPMVKMLVRAIGADRLMLITDAIRAADMPDGQYDLGGLNVTVLNGACKLENGTLAGSVLTMSRAVQTVQKLAGISPFAAQTMASTNPARRLQLPRKGELAKDYDADVVAFDKAGNVMWTMVRGHIVYDSTRQG